MNTEKEIDIIKRQFESIANQILAHKDTDGYFHEFSFNTLELFDHEGYTKHPNSNEDSPLPGRFGKLHGITNHCLYWFELKDEASAEKLNQLLDNYRLKKDKTVPTHNKNKDSNILYVGVRRGKKISKNGASNIVGRINQHLGYYGHKKTQGLQLYEYAREESFDITVKVVEFVNFHPIYLNVVEKMVAHELRPLCGRH